MSLRSTLDLARSQLGTVESPPSSNNVKYAQWYGMNNEPWCAMFVSWVLAHTEVGSQYRHAAVSFSLDAARKQGRSTGEFRAGYVACKINSGGDWGPGHTGIVEAVHSDGSVTTIEGNTSPGDGGSQRDGGGVWRRRRPRSYWNKGCISVAYIVVPDDNQPKPPPPPAPGAPAFPGRVLRLGVNGADVRTWQQKMKDRGWSRMGVDGDFGPVSKDLCTQFQRSRGLLADGEVGPQTWAATWR